METPVKSPKQLIAQYSHYILSRSTGVFVTLLVASLLAGAQSVHFAGVETVVASSGLANPVQVATDAGGDVFILGAGSSRLLKEAPLSGGYQESVVSSTTMNSPTGIAVDSAGHLFVVDSGNNRILEETPSG